MTDKNTIVSTRQGNLEGTYEYDLYIFKGIPYAAPPVGPLRWLPPQPAEKWDGVRPAKQYGAMSMQIPMSAPSDSPGAPNFGNVPMSEDCLYLNVWTPGLDDGKRPVLLWIHGGGFTIGAGSESFLDKGILAKKGDIVLVALNYRLGAAGFMNLNEITGGRIPASGNEGLLDQVAALDWIQENIAAFGGDPDNITISGFSAGGMSVGHLMAFPAAKGKFHKAMNRSGAANIISTLDEAVDISREYLNVFNLKGTDAEALRGLSADQMLDGQNRLANVLREKGRRMSSFQPVHDGKTMPEIPMVAIRNGSTKNIAVMAGSSRDELKSSMAANPAFKNLTDEDIVRQLSGAVDPKITERVTKTYRSTRGKQVASLSGGELLGAINTDLMFRIPTIQLLEVLRGYGSKVFNYLFCYPSPAMNGALGAMHGLDNPFLFGALDGEFTGNGQAQQLLAEQIQDSAIAFIRNGDPSCKSAGAWPEYNEERHTMIWDTPAREEPAPFEDERSAWDGFEVITSGMM